MAEGKVLVLGIGNPLFGDDGVGPRVVQNLARRTHRPGLDFLDGGTAGPNLLGYLEGYSHLVVVDALDAGLAPGTICRLTPGEIASMGGKLSFHQTALDDLLALARLIGILPETVIFGIQVERLGWGTDLSPSVAAKLPVLEKLIMEEVENILRPPRESPPGAPPS